jgi:hypothetical protein
VKEYFADLDYYFLCQSFSWVSANRSTLLATQVSKNNVTSLQAYDYNHLISLRLFGSHLLAQLCELWHKFLSKSSFDLHPSSNNLSQIVHEILHYSVLDRKN